MKFRTNISTTLVVALLMAGATSLLADDVADTNRAEELVIRQAINKVAASTVRIETVGGLEKIGKLLLGTGPTTGLIVSEEGHILSSAFNFVGNPTNIFVTIPGSDQRVQAKIVARDNSRMMVMLKVETDKKLTVPELVGRDQMLVGQWTIALGRTYPGGATNLSEGILSAKNRVWGKAIQTDAKISPSNYGGPLIDMRGRVMGLLVPLSPQSQGEVAGAEWYDSGIGFAIPLAELKSQIETLKKGEDLHAGIMGVNLKPGDLFGERVTIAAVQPKSPADKAGIKKGDVIVELDGKVIASQAQLKHQLGPHYAGDKIKVVVERDKKRVETEFVLAETLAPYERPFLGILPRRDGDKGVPVRFVYPGSPAEDAAIQPGDVIVEADGKPVETRDELLEHISVADKEVPLALGIDRDGKRVELQITLGGVDVKIPSKLPPAIERSDENAVAEVGEVDLKLAEERNECFAYVPKNYRAGEPHGVLIWLHAPGAFDKKKMVSTWKDACDAHQMILLAPQAAKKERWERTEVAFVRKALDELKVKYDVDPARVVVGGYQGGGAMAYLVAFSHRDVIRGVATVDAGLPLVSRPPAASPLEALFVYTSFARSSKSVKTIDAGVKRLKSLKHPVTVVETLIGGPLGAARRAELARWVDTLDRI